MTEQEQEQEQETPYFRDSQAVQPKEYYRKILESVERDNKDKGKEREQR